MRTSIYRLVIIMMGVVAFSAATAGFTVQSNRATQNEDVLPALLVEIRGLRAAMEQMASAGPSAQLALARLQLQEQRINTMLRRVEAIRDKLAASQSEVTNKQLEVSRIEAALRDGRVPADERLGAEAHLKTMQGSLIAPRAEVQRLTAEETALASEISAEQARWAEFNQRLEQLERALTRQ